MANPRSAESVTTGRASRSDRKFTSGGTQNIAGWLSLVAGCLMVAGTLLPWVSGIADLTGYYGQNLFHLSASGEFTIDGVFGVGLGGVALLFGMARVAPTILPARLARSPAWTTLGCALLLGVDIPRADQVVRAANQTPHVGGAWLGLGIWVFGSGMAVAFASALLLLLANSPSPK